MRPDRLLGFILIALVMVWTANALAQGYMDGGTFSYSSEDQDGPPATPAFPHPFAPLGVPGSHVIKPGKWLFAYTYGHMAMDGNLDGTQEVSTSEILKRYKVAPESMDVDMHMVCLMRGLTQNLTLMAMMPYFFKTMDMEMRNGTKFSADSDGIGDLQLSGIYSFYRTDMHQFVFTGGIGVPTGSTNARGDTPVMKDQKLGYTMQLGAGSPALLPALSYLGKSGPLHWGAQVSGAFYLGQNQDEYRLGDRYRFTGWVGYRVWDSLISSLRLDWQQWGNIHGGDPEFDPTSTPGKDPDARGGSRLDLLPGLSLFVDKGPLKGNRFFVEGGVPIYQYLDGPQGEMSWMMSAGWRIVF